jgi:outer membrane biosynthesis protein TonB
MKNWMSFWNRPKTLVAVVAAAHGLAMLCFVVSKSEPLVQRQPTHLVVNTVKLKPKPQPQPQPKSKPKSQSVAKAVIASTPKQKPKPKTRPAKKSDNRLAKLMAEAQNRLSKVATTVEAKQPVQLDLAIDTGTYEQELAERLRLLLKLPEWGSVRVALTVARDGSVVGLKILEAQSETNRVYVASHLEGQALAPFGKEYAGEVQHTFRLTLNNEL